MYFEVQFQVEPVDPGREILIAELGVIGFDGFTETESGLITYTDDPKLKNALGEALEILENPNFQVSYYIKKIQYTNWNAKWESDFEPIRISEDCYIRAPFHEASGAKYEIEIMPRMSFGTGHHETTQLVLEMMFEIDFRGKSILDMGCGTGIIAIMAEKLGAEVVDAIDIDPGCQENTEENAIRNSCKKITAKSGDSSQLVGKGPVYDIVLANINLNVLLDDIMVYASVLRKPGILLLSGFYLEDLDAISAKCIEVGLEFHKSSVKNNWVCAKYVF